MVLDDNIERAIARLTEAIRENPDGALPEDQRRALFEVIDWRFPVHGKLRRGMVYLLSAASLFSNWKDDPRLRPDLFQAPFEGLDVCRLLLLEEASPEEVGYTFARMESWESMFAEATSGQGQSWQLTLAQQCTLGAVASALHYCSLPSKEEEWGAPDTPREVLLPEVLACLGHTGYSPHTQGERERVSAFWHWWIENVVRPSLRPLDSVFEQLRDLEPSPYGVRKLTYLR